MAGFIFSDESRFGIGGDESLCGGPVVSTKVELEKSNEDPKHPPVTAAPFKVLREIQTKSWGARIRGTDASSCELRESLTQASSAFPEFPSQPVDSQLCVGSVPSTSQLCHISCPIECEVSPWGAWGPCTFENCNDQSVKKGFKFRRRKITNYPTGGEGDCPHLVEAIPCEEPTCFDWQLLKLEECVPDEDMDCGRGTQLPQARCINSDGEMRRSSFVHEAQTVLIGMHQYRYPVWGIRAIPSSCTCTQLY
ncbi:hypothetical protein NFI96_007054 [Prochilodus magdalenae]|nr:hypothetical protein NFI96_007054 [Prochilodus magdalenae]